MDNIPFIDTQSGINEIMFNNFMFGLKRANKNARQVWICTHKPCSSFIVIGQGSITNKSCIHLSLYVKVLLQINRVFIYRYTSRFDYKKSHVKSDQSHKFQHQ